MRSSIGIRVVAFALAGGLAATACQSSGTPTASVPAPPGQQVLRLNNGTEPSSYDPTQMTYSFELAIGRQVFEALLRAKPDLSDVQPAAAEGFDVSPDGLTYTFHLRPNAKWSDGKPVTSSDWLYGFRHLLNPALAAGYADPFFTTTIAGAEGYGSVDVKSASAIDAYLSSLGISAPDADTFVIRLAHPAPYFKWVVSLGVAVPLRKDVVEKTAGGPFPLTDTSKPEMWANDSTTVVGNGPFKIWEIVPQGHITLIPNEHYWAGAATIRQLIMYFASTNTQFNMYRTGALDMAAVPNTQLDYVRGDPTLAKQAHIFPGLSTSWVAFNTHVPPLDKANVRLALAKAIDRQKLAADVLHGNAQARTSFIPQGMSGYDPSDAMQSFDPAAAKKLLSEAGVSAAEFGKLHYLTAPGSALLAENEFIVDQWNTNLGLSIQLERLPIKTIIQRIRKGQFDIYGPDGWAADYPDAQDWYDIFVSAGCGTLNWGCPSIPVYDSLVQRADDELNPALRGQEYQEAQKVLIDNAVVAFLAQGGTYALIAPYVHVTVTPIDETPGDLNFWSAYITAH